MSGILLRKILIFWKNFQCRTGTKSQTLVDSKKNLKPAMEASKAFELVSLPDQVSRRRLDPMGSTFRLYFTEDLFTIGLKDQIRRFSM